MTQPITAGRIPESLAESARLGIETLENHRRYHQWKFRRAWLAELERTPPVVVSAYRPMTRLATFWRLVLGG